MGGLSGEGLSDSWCSNTTSKTPARAPPRWATWLTAMPPTMDPPALTGIITHTCLIHPWSMQCNFCTWHVEQKIQATNSLPLVCQSIYQLILYEYIQSCGPLQKLWSSGNCLWIQAGKSRKFFRSVVMWGDWHVGRLARNYLPWYEYCRQGSANRACLQ